MIYLDTHVAAWLYAGRVDLFPDPVRRLLDTEDLLISPMVQLELQCLYELGRTAEPGATVVGALGAELGLRVCDLPFAQIMACALDQSWTRDPFDRLIVSQAAIRRTQLLTRDETIREHYEHAVWVRD